MKCPNCSNEQAGGSFCSHCGERLVEHKKAQTVQQETRQETTSQAPPQMNLQKGDRKESTNKKHLKKTNLKKRKFTATEFKIAIYFSISSLAMIAMIAWALTYLLKSSTLIKDYTYMFLASITELPEHILIQFISKIKVTIWDILLVAHGGSTRGEILVDGLEPVEFVWKLPVVIAPLLLLFILIITSRLLKKKFTLTIKQYVHITLISACLYAVIIMVFMLFMNPSYGIEGQFLYNISTQPLTIFVRAFVMCVIASFIGFQLWKVELIQKSTLLRPIFNLKAFFTTLLTALFVVGIIIVVMWFLVHPASIFSQPLTTPASLWTLYQTDPLFYLLLPTFWVGELLYSLGSSFAITSADIGELLQIPQEIKFHNVTGIRVMEGVALDENYLHQIERSTKFVWYSIAFLLVFLYSLHRVRLTNLGALISQMIFIGIIFSGLATAVSFTFTSSTENIAGMIGFPMLWSGMATMIVCLLYCALRYLLKKRIIDTKVGEHHGNK